MRAKHVLATLLMASAVGGSSAIGKQSPAQANELAGVATLPPSLAAAALADESVSFLVTLRTADTAAQGDVAPTSAARTLEQSWTPLGLVLRRRFTGFPVLVASLPGRLLPELAADPLVAGLSTISKVRVQRAEGKKLMKVGDVQSRGYRGRGIGIAILDTGVDYTHPELSPGGRTATAKTVKLHDAIDGDGDPKDENGHGTSVAGIAAGSDGGVAPDSTVVAVRVLNADGEGTTEQILDGIDAVLASVHAGNPYNIKVLNMSLGGYDDDWPPKAGTCDSQDTASATALQALTEAGILVVVAAGNGGCTLGVSWPACMSNALAVGAVYDDEICAIPAPWPIDCMSTSMSFGGGQCMASGCTQDTKSDRISCYSDSGDKLGVWAPAHCAKTPKKGGGYEECFGGTSAAAPYAAGVVALLAQAYPYFGPSALRTALETTGNPRHDDRNGVTRNRVDALAAFTYLTTYCPAPGLPQGVAPSVGFVCAAGSYSLSWSGGGSADSYRVERSQTSDFAAVETFASTGTSLALTFTGAGELKLYHRVRAERSCGSFSPWSNVVELPYYPDCPRQVRRHLRANGQ